MEVQEKQSFKDKIIEVIIKGRTAIIVAGVVLAVALVALVVVQQVNDSSRTANSLLLDTLDMAYGDWKAEVDDTKKAPLATALDAAIAAAQAGSPTARQYALFVQGNYQYDKKAYAEAAEAYSKAAAINSKSYLYPVSAFLAAGAYEEAGDLAKCKENLKLAMEASGPNPLAIRATFSFARILEAEANTAEAKIYYQKIVDANPQSSWTKLAQDRIIYLEVSAQ